jgi:hypothetical protein
MKIQTETAAPTGIGNGGGISKAVTAQNCHIATDTATTEHPVRVVASRFRLTISTAREVCRMAGIGERHA